MVLDLGSFTRRGLLVDCVRPADTWGRTNHGEGRGCKSRKEAEEDRENTDLSVMVK